MVVLTTFIEIKKIKLPTSNLRPKRRFDVGNEHFGMSGVDEKL
jgi:hypothetical protein